MKLAKSVYLHNCEKRDIWFSRKGTDYNMPTQKSIELGLFEIKETAITHAEVVYLILCL